MPLVLSGSGSILSVLEVLQITGNVQLPFILLCLLLRTIPAITKPFHKSTTIALENLYRMFLQFNDLYIFVSDRFVRQFSKNLSYRKLCHCSCSGNASPNSGLRRKATLITLVITQRRSITTNQSLTQCLFSLVFKHFFRVASPLPFFILMIGPT